VGTVRISRGNGPSFNKGGEGWIGTLEICKRSVNGALLFLYATKTWSGEYGIQPSGTCFVRARGKVLSQRTTIPAGEDWTFMRGIDNIDVKRQGIR